MLDDATAIGRIDAGGMLDRVRQFGQLAAEGWRAAEHLAPPAASPSAIVACGMGGSGIGGDLLRALAAPVSPIPVVVTKSDRLPAFVGSTTLVLACSYSGHTEETLAAYEAAARAGAQVVAITSGGALAERARARGHRVVSVPGGWPPRSALPLLLMPMVRIAASLGVVSVTAADVADAVRLLDRLAAAWGGAGPARDNPTRALAQALEGALPFVCATSPLSEPAALRWKTQLNENAKTPALAVAFPELTHNDVVGWEGRDVPSPWHAVVLRDREEAARDALRLQVTREVAFARARGYTEVWSQGEGALARLLSLVLFGDFVSCYLAVRRGIDPTPVTTIDRIKARMAAG
jgi:glucose/mannose-6-phosphate isomerase